MLNPVAGRISDRSQHPDGKRRPFLIRAGLLLAACFALLFLGPTSPPWAGAAWVAVAYLACATAYSFFQVPYVAMPAEITDDYDERTRLMTWRVAILALAILVSGGLSPVIRDAFGPVWGYRAVGFFVAALIALGAWGAWHGTRRARVVAGVVTSTSFGDQLRLIRSDRPFRLLLTTFVLQALATGAMLAGVDYVARWVLGSPSAASLLFVCFVAPALVVTPLWQRYGTARDKKRGYLARLAPPRGRRARARPVALDARGAVVYLCVAVVGVGYAGAQMFPMAMLPDVASRTGERAVARRSLHGRVDRRGDARSGSRPRRVCRRARSRRLRVLHRVRLSSNPTRRSPRSRSASRSCRPCSSRSRSSPCAATASSRLTAPSIVIRTTPAITRTTKGRR